MTQKIELKVGNVFTLADYEKTPVVYAGDKWEEFEKGKIRVNQNPEEGKRCHMFLRDDSEEGILWGCAINERFLQRKKNLIISDKGYEWGAFPPTFENYQELFELTRGILKE